QAEIHPGFGVNFAVLTAAASGLLVLLIGCVMLSAATMVTTRRGSRHRHARRRGRAADDVLRRWGLGPSATLGVNAALVRRPGAALRRSTVTAVAIAMVAVVGTATFETSLDHLVSSPKQQGWTFDVVVGNLNDQNDQVARDAPLLTRNHDVAAFSAIATPPETPAIDGHNTGLVGVDEMQGNLEPRILAGRFARRPDEIVLGR